jgi:hypothetical protein
LTPKTNVYFDRRISTRLLALLRDGPLTPLLARRHDSPDQFDVLLGGAPHTSICFASLYYGLTTILTVEESKQNGLRLDTHLTHRTRGVFDEQWREWQTPEGIGRIWPDVECYLNRVRPTVDPRWNGLEGPVQTSMCIGTTEAYRVIGREANVGFRNTTVQQAVVTALNAVINTAVQPLEAMVNWLRKKNPGTGADLLAVDPAGRLLVIEIKPASATGGISWAPAQARLYAELFAHWAERTSDAAEILNEMLDQRVELGLTPAAAQGVGHPPRIIPVVAVGPGKRSSQALPRLGQMAESLAAVPTLSPAIDPLQVWLLDEHGHPQEVLTPCS